MRCREGGYDHRLSQAKPIQSRITFDTQLKLALFVMFVFFVFRKKK